LSLDHLRPLAIGEPSPDERHLVADDDQGRHRLLLVRPFDRPRALALPIDAAMPIRLDAASRLTRSGGSVLGYQPTPLQRARLTLLLRVLDAEAAGEPKRAIAAKIIYPHMPTLHGAAWKASTERRRTHRLCQEAMRLRDEGVLDLLHKRLHPPG
jgi:hypothetical protein